MVLSDQAKQFAVEIKMHEWDDTPYRVDRAGHQTGDDHTPQKKRLSQEEAQRVRINAAAVVAQVLGYTEPDFDLMEFMEACGVNVQRFERGIPYVVRRDAEDNKYYRPGSWDK